MRKPKSALGLTLGIALVLCLSTDSFAKRCALAFGERVARPGDSFLYLSSEDVRRLQVSMGTIIEKIREMFVLKRDGDAEIAPKMMIRPRAGEDAYVTAMPGHLNLKESVVTGIKSASNFPRNVERGFDSFNGLITLFSGVNGFPLALVDARWVTAMRTAAATAVAAEKLAPRGELSMGIVGCGVQARTNLEALLEVRPGIKRVLAYDLRTEAAVKFASEMSNRFGIEVRAVESLRDAIEGQDIVLTAARITARPSFPVRAEWIKKGAFVATLDFDSSLDPKIYSKANVFTDDWIQLDAKREEGFFSKTPAIKQELSDFVVEKLSREYLEQTHVFLNLGIATSDLIVVEYLYRLALEREVGVKLPYSLSH